MCLPHLLSPSSLSLSLSAHLAHMKLSKSVCAKERNKLFLIILAACCADANAYVILLSYDEL